MLHETITSLTAAEVIDRAKEFFAERVPHLGAFLEKEGPTYAAFRGQGGEELVVAIIPHDGPTRVRASSLLFDQPIDRFFSTLPPADGQDA